MLWIDSKFEFWRQNLTALQFFGAFREPIPLVGKIRTLHRFREQDFLFALFNVAM